MMAAFRIYSPLFTCFYVNRFKLAAIHLVDWDATKLTETEVQHASCGLGALGALVPPGEARGMS